MDDHNAAHFWGVSPPIDLLDLHAKLHPSGGTAAAEGSEEPLCFLQVSPYDLRHTLYTISRAHRHRGKRPVHIYVHEEEPEVLARHLLLWAVLLDTTRIARERMEMFLELHGNAFLRENTADYMGSLGKELADLVTEATAGGDYGTTLSKLFDLSLLKYGEKDLMVEAFKTYSRKKEYDMHKAWEVRCRRWYGERYDFRKNAIDWDYHMRLMQAGTHGVTAKQVGGHIIHAVHFRTWRMHGVAYELRDSAYTQPNKSLLSTAYGRTKEFKDYAGRDKGRSVAAWGMWADILNSPYHSFGVTCEDDKYFKLSNQQFTHTEMDVAEHNINAVLHELRTGTTPDEAASTHRSNAASGVTSMERMKEIAEASVQNANADMPVITEEGEEEEEGDAAEGSDAANGDSADGDAVASLEKKLAVTHVAASGSDADATSARAAETTEAATSASPGDDATSAGEWLPAATAEAALDANMAEILSRFKIFLVTGDLKKALTGKRKFAERFSITTVGHRHAHLIEEAHGLPTTSTSDGSLVAETGAYLLQLNKDQAAAFEDKIVEMATKSGWKAPKADAPDLTSAHRLFCKS